jgi:hypothetical protein
VKVVPDVGAGEVDGLLLAGCDGEVARVRRRHDERPTGRVRLPSGDGLLLRLGLVAHHDLFLLHAAAGWAWRVTLDG